MQCLIVTHTISRLHGDFSIVLPLSTYSLIFRDKWDRGLPGWIRQDDHRYAPVDHGHKDKHQYGDQLNKTHKRLEFLYSKVITLSLGSGKPT
jgi:hypothetical protein